jgi:hypothetical protein
MLGLNESSPGASTSGISLKNSGRCKKPLGNLAENSFHIWYQEELTDHLFYKNIACFPSGSNDGRDGSINQWLGDGRLKVQN